MKLKYEKPSVLQSKFGVQFIITAGKDVFVGEIVCEDKKTPTAMKSGSHGLLTVNIFVPINSGYYEKTSSFSAVTIVEARKKIQDYLNKTFHNYTDALVAEYTASHSMHELINLDGGYRPSIGTQCQKNHQIQLEMSHVADIYDTLQACRNDPRRVFRF